MRNLGGYRTGRRDHPCAKLKGGAPRRGFDSSRARRRALRGGQLEDSSNDDLEGSTACRLRCGRHPRRRRSSRSFFAMRISRRRSSITTSTTTSTTKRSACLMLGRRWRHCPPLEYVNPGCARPAPMNGAVSVAVSVAPRNGTKRQYRARRSPTERRSRHQHKLRRREKMHEGL